MRHRDYTDTDAFLHLALVYRSPEPHATHKGLPSTAQKPASRAKHVSHYRRRLAISDHFTLKIRLNMTDFQGKMIAMIYPRLDLQQAIAQALTRSRVVMLVGPRQCGKTTLAHQFVPADALNYFDLEDPVGLVRLDQPMTALQGLTSLVVIDEVQRRPELFPVLRVLCDRTPLPARFLILGSASPELLRQSSESLAGRVEVIRMGGFSLAEVGAEMQMRHWLRGGFPLAFLAASETDTALTDLELDQLLVVYPGDRPYPLAEHVSVVPLAYLARGSDFLAGNAPAGT